MSHDAMVVTQKQSNFQANERYHPHPAKKILFDTEGVVHSEDVPGSQIVNKIFYLEVLGTTVFVRKFPICDRQDWFPYYDNAPVYSSGSNWQPKRRSRWNISYLETTAWHCSGFCIKALYWWWVRVLWLWPRNKATFKPKEDITLKSWFVTDWSDSFTKTMHLHISVQQLLAKECYVPPEKSLRR